VRVFLKPTDFRDDEILLNAYSPGGSGSEPLELHWSASLAAGMVGAMGLGDFDPIALQKKLAGKQVFLQPWVSQLEEGMQGSATPADFETLLQLVYLYFTHPREDPALFDALKQRWGAMLANRDKSPERAFADTLEVTLSRHHPRTLPLTAARLASVELEPTYEVFRDRFGDATDFTFVLVGSFEPEAIEPLVTRWLGGLPHAGRVETRPDLGIEAPEGVVSRVVRRGSEPKARTAIVFHGPFTWDRRNRHTLSSLASILEIRLREVLREELSGTYGVSVQESRRLYPDPRYQLQIGFGTDPDRLGSLSEQVFTILEEMREMGPTADEVAKVKEQQRRDHEESLRENGGWISHISFRDSHGIDLREVLDTEAVIDALTAEEVRDGARRWLDLDRYVQVSLVPAP
jgi:zinc protease